MLNNALYNACWRLKSILPENIWNGLRRFSLKSRIIELYAHSEQLCLINALRSLFDAGKCGTLTSEQEKILKSPASPKNLEKLILTWYDQQNELFNFNGAKIPYGAAGKDIEGEVLWTLEIFLFFLLFDDNYDISIAGSLDKYLMGSAPYCWKDGNFDVTVHKGDIVIDAGAWIGDFSAYASVKGAFTYAFEPAQKSFAVLQQTAGLNERIIPVEKGLSDKNGKLHFYLAGGSGMSDSLVLRDDVPCSTVETVAVTTLDDFVFENNLPRVDFIKADIEGAERDMLKGAQHVLKTFAPRLALCTYHLPDDPEVMARLIKEANPDYRIVQREKKLYASVV
jgi:FkbM family methyltransferase